jgi:hypothetical protein
MRLNHNKKQLITIAMTTLLAIICWIPYLQTLFPHLSYGDEGMVLQSAYRVYLGQIPYRDFFTSSVPGSYYWTAFIFFLFGPTLLAARIGTLVVAAIIMALTCLTLKKFRPKSLLTYLLVGAFLLQFGGPYWFIASHHWVALALSLASFYLLLPNTQNEPSPCKTVLAGSFAGAAALTLQHLGGIWIICATIAILTTPALKKRTIITQFLSGIALIALPVAIFFITTSGVQTLYYDLIEFPLTQYHKIAAHKGLDLSYFSRIIEMVSTSWQTQNNLLDLLRTASIATLFTGVVIVNCLPFIGLAGLIFLWRSSSFSRLQLALLTAFFTAHYLKVLFRITDQTLVFAAPAALIIIILAADQLRQRTTTKKATDTFDLTWLTLFGSIAVVTLAFHLYSPKLSTSTPAGTVYSLKPEYHQSLERFSTFFKERNNRGEPVYCYPYSPLLYFLFHTENPSRHDTLVYPMATDEQRAEVIEQLESTGTSWIIMTSQVSGDPFVQYLEQEYIVRERLPLAFILEKRRK